MTMNLTEYKLKPREPIVFRLSTPQYGRAEFVFCPVWRRRHITSLSIYPKQQPDAEHFYTLDGLHSTGIDFWAQVPLDDPKVWLVNWCAEHNTQAIFVYPPDGTCVLTVDTLSTLSVMFGPKGA